MITSHLTGNIGNHISQYSICRIIAESKGFDFGFDTPTHDYHKGMNQMYFMEASMGCKVEGIQHYFEEHWDMYKSMNVTVFDKRVYDIGDNTCLIGHNGAYGGLYQSEDYYVDWREKMLQWFAIKPDYAQTYDLLLEAKGIVLDDNLCVINFRGGEYRGIPEVLLRKEYWRDAVIHMRNENPDMRFLCITDDVELATEYMPHEMPVIHEDIGFDYYVVNQAKWLIISNSSFGMWAAWLNEKVHMTIAPKYWAAHNHSENFWQLADQYNRRFTYLDRYGLLFDYSTCKAQAIEFYKSQNILTQLYE